MRDTTLRQVSKIIVVSIALVIAFAIVFYTMPRKGDVVVINCSISEISPDFTPAMREACRQARAEKFKEDLQKPK
jgi:hypothetical protein